MKTACSAKFRFALLFILAASVFYSLGCSTSGTEAPPIYLPAPTGGWINATAPDADGNVLVFGYIYADGVAKPDVDVTVTNSNTGNLSETTADSSAYFETEIPAALGDVLKVKYTDPVTHEESEETSVTVTEGIQQMTSLGMVPYDISLNSGNGDAVVVANDGQSSQLIVISDEDGSVVGRASFSNMLFDKAAVHSALNYAAVLDIQNRMLYWFDLANLADDMAPTSWDNLNDTPSDVAVADLADTPWTTDDMVIVSNAWNATAFNLFHIYAIGTGATPTLGFPTTANCISAPNDIFYPNCSAANDPMPVAAGLMDMRVMAGNRTALAAVIEYAGGVRAVHYLTFNQTATGLPITINLTTGAYDSGLLNTGVVPYAIKWYDDETAMMTAVASGTLTRLSASGGVIASSEFAVGTTLTGLACDSANSRVFVADSARDAVMNLNASSNFSETASYNAVADPTGVAYYGGTTPPKLNIVLTSPRPMIRTEEVE